MDQFLEERRVGPLRSRLAVGPESSVRELVRVHLAEEAAVLPEVETVVRGEDDGGLLHQAHVLDGFHQETQPGVDHGDLAAVGGVALPEPLLGVARHVVPVPVHRQHHLAVVSRPVKLGVVGRSVPGFMGVPGVDV